MGERVIAILGWGWCGKKPVNLAQALDFANAVRKSPFGAYFTAATHGTSLEPKVWLAVDASLRIAHDPMLIGPDAGLAPIGSVQPLWTEVWPDLISHLHDSDEVSPQIRQAFMHGYGSKPQWFLTSYAP